MKIYVILYIVFFVKIWYNNKKIYFEVDIVKKHILLDKAFVYAEPTVIPIPHGYSFNEKRGYWTNDTTGEAMILNDNYSVPATKKCDRETGEDQKGE